MIQYSDPDPESDSVSRMVHWNPSNGFQLPFGIFEDNASNNEVAGNDFVSFIIVVCQNDNLTCRTLFVNLFVYIENE